MESLKLMDDTLYRITEGIDEVLAYFDEIEYGWKHGREYEYAKMENAKEDLKDALKDAQKLSNSFKYLKEGEELER